MKIAILGGKHAILGFKALGLAAFGVLTLPDAKNALEKIKKSDEYGILFVTEDWAPKLEEELAELTRRALPAIVTVPSQKGSTGEGLRNLKKIMERAVGSDILFKEE